MELRTIPVGDCCFSRSNKILQCFLDESTLCAPINLNCLFSDSVSPSKRSNIIEHLPIAPFLITCWERGESNVLNNNFDKLHYVLGNLQYLLIHAWSLKIFCLLDLATLHAVSITLSMIFTKQSVWYKNSNFENDFSFFIIDFASVEIQLRELLRKK